MTEYIQSLIIGAIQGVSEFLPVSSSGHLVLVPYMFSWDYRGLSFDVALHFGTLLAIVIYFGKDWVEIIGNAFRPALSKGPVARYPKDLLWKIVVASIPAAIVGVFIEDYVEEFLHSPLLLATNLVVFGALLWLSDKYAKKHDASKTQLLSYGNTFLIGLAQAIALVPGVSRSGITMTAGRALGLDRDQAARISFLLGTPAMAGAFLFKLGDLKLISLDHAFWSGFIASTAFGFITIKYLLQYLRKSDFSIFFWYRLMLAIVVIFTYFAK
ncbi:MAG: Undecaprenyl-diphosphatase [bacterium ADurb.Bin400]|nr:MAG: Undecaprenyl-diphosphatase [bacterium ADurb.Bin400]